MSRERPWHRPLQRWVRLAHQLERMEARHAQQQREIPERDKALEWRQAGAEDHLLDAMDGHWFDMSEAERLQANRWAAATNTETP